MILNLPSQFPLQKLDQITMGDADGGEDALLERCACMLSAMQELLMEKKQIVVGDRGTGKTALAKLIHSGKLKFANPNDKKQLILVIDDEIDYRGIREYLRAKGLSKGADKTLSYRLIWEIFLLYRILSFLSNDGPAKDDFAKMRKEFSAAVGLEDPKPKLLDLLVRHKKTIGIKVDDLERPTPSLAPFMSLEPGSGSAPSDHAYISLNEYRDRISKRLADANTVLYVLADRLDEFVVGEQYQTQRHVLEGLLECHRGYSAFKWVYLRPFLRYDLFQRLSFEKLGPEKVRAKTVELRWSGTEIREFIAKRLLYNYFTLFSMQRIEVDIDTEKLSIDQRGISDIASMQGAAGLIWRLVSIFIESVTGGTLLKGLGWLGVPVPKGRTTYFNDEVNRTIILTIFPEKFELIQDSGHVAQVSFFRFLESYFVFGTDCCTPRTFLMFVEKCFEQARNYYRLNQDLTVQLRDGNYRLLTSEMISRAYEDIRRLAWDSVVGISSEWAQLASRLRQERQGRTQLTFIELEAMTKVKRDRCKEFAAFVVHAGALKCENPAARHEDRLYSVPRLFQGQ